MMIDLKNEGLEVVRMQPVAVADHNGDLRWMTARFVADCELYAMPDFGRAPDLCRRSEALAGYAERDAWIAAQDVQIKALQSGENSWQSGYDEGRRMGGKHCMLTVDQLRAELAALNAKLDASKFCANVDDDLRAELDAAKETISRYEVTAENCDVLRAELAAIKARGVTDFVFSGELPNATFVEVEDGNGNSINVGEWFKRDDGYSVLRLYAAPVAKQEGGQDE